MAAHRLSSDLLSMFQQHLTLAKGGAPSGHTSGGGASDPPLKLEDTNCAKIGSAEDHAAHKEAAKHEPAWRSAGVAPGVQVWRIEKFKVQSWPANEYGTFYQGDAYIVISTRKSASGDLSWDIHFWLGADCTADEAGTAAYKTVEFDSLKDGKPVEYREAQGYESEQFLSYFKPAVQILQGGVASGFHHVTPETYQTRLLRVVKQGRETRVLQVPARASSLSQGDAYVLDAGLHLYEFIGANASPFERAKATSIVEKLLSDRRGATRGDVPSPAFWAALGGEGPIAAEHPAETPETPVAASLWCLSNTGGEVSFTKVCDAPLNKSHLHTGDVFIADTGHELFVWVGAGADARENLLAMPTAMKYLEDNGRPAHMHITKVKEGAETAAFNAAFH